MTVTIRLAVLSDAPAMAEIHVRSWEAAYKDIIPAEYIKKRSEKRPAQWQSILSQANDTRYIIEADGKPAGMVCAGEPQDDNVETLNDSGIDGSFYELQAMYLHPDFFRRGIGTKAMNFAIEKGRAAGKSYMILWVLEDNKSAVEFYKACGFAADGAYKLYDYGKELKVIRMRRKISFKR